MTRTSQEAEAALGRTNALPYGVARTAATLAEVERIEAEGPDEVRAYAYTSLVDAYVWGGDVAKAYVPFTRALRLYDERPDLFDAYDSHALFWSFKWMVGHLSDFPEISVSQITSTLEDMARRFAVAGHGMNAVELSRFQWARARGAAPEEVAAAYETWVATPRDDYSQCEACEPGDRAAYLFEVGRRDEGIRLLETVLTGSPSCATEPGDMLSHLQLAYLDAGDADAVVRAHRRGLRHLEGETPLNAPTARHVELLARTGNHGRAPRMLEKVAAALLEADSPGERLSVLTHVGVGTRVIATAEPSTPVSLPGVPASTVGELAAWIDAEARELARAFDARNGNDAASARLTRSRDRDGRTLRVDLDVLPTSAAPDDHDAFQVAAGEPGSEGAGNLDDALTLLAQAESLAADDRVAAARVYAQASALAEAEGDLETAGLALAEAAQLAALEDDAVGATGAFRRALALLRAGGADPRTAGPVARAAAAVAPERVDQEAVLQVVDRVITEIAGQQPDEPAPGHGTSLTARDSAQLALEAAELRDTRARLLATLGNLDEAAEIAADVAVEMAALGRTGDAAHAFWLAGRCRAQSDPEAAVALLESAVEGFTLVRGERSSRGAASDELVELLTALGREDDAAAVLSRLMAT